MPSWPTCEASPPWCRTSPRATAAKRPTRQPATAPTRRPAPTRPAGAEPSYRVHSVRMSILCGEPGRAIAVAIALAMAASGCTHVPPYARGRLAHPTMTTGDLAGPAEVHERGVQEGAVGGGSVAEGGCGCN